jgi:SNF2 family DNA or RNA helicase
MIKLEHLKSGIYISGLEGADVVQIKSIEFVGSEAATVLYKNSHGQIREQLLHRSDEERLQLANNSRPWTFKSDGKEFKLAIEAQRIRLAHLFDPMMAVHTSNVEPLPHQISAVYESMLPRQPLRYVLADDPGAGKTIMAGLFIRELVMRADARRILIVTPGSLSDQWQEELWDKFGLQFQLFSREKQEQSATGNFFEEASFLIARLDQLARREDYIEKLQATEWDLIIVDEAHKLSASYFGEKINESLRYKLGKVLGQITRHFLLMTATPHNGKEAEFQLWMGLLDGDRFYGKFREGAHKVDVTDMMRRMVKEDLLRFDGTKLFPERRAYTANYELSDLEAALYASVTTYVKEEMDRAENMLKDNKRKGTVGFALTQLQRRLASSPEAIFQSIKRRRKRLESKREEMKLVHRGQLRAEVLSKYETDVPEDLDDAIDELNAEEYEQWTEDVVDQATAAQTIEELEKEILSLKDLEEQARAVVASEEDRKWNELRRILSETPEMKLPGGGLRKIIIFTEHRDTLNYLQTRITTLIGNPDAVVTIHGGTNRDLRKKVQVQFRNHPEVRVLLATDAAGEGVNLQNANLMVNYDLPWNPNRIEQRFGRIHRIGQTEVCHLWNMVAKETREGDVFNKLFEKLEVQRKALGGRVFDVLGEAFDGISLKDLLIQAIRYGEDPKVRAEQKQVIEGALDTERLKSIMERNALVDNEMSLEALYAIKDEMDKAEARKLQPYFIHNFFATAFESLGGELKPRETGRYEIRYVPGELRERDRVISETKLPIAKAYERICFDKQFVRLDDKPMADLIHSGHPLMASVIDVVLERHRTKLQEGSVLVDPTDDSIEPRCVFMIEHSVKESGGYQLTASQRLQFVSIGRSHLPSFAGWAPHLDLRPIEPAELASVEDILKEPWLANSPEGAALKFSSETLAPEHYLEVKTRRERQASKILNAVNERLIKEIDHWSHRYETLREDVSKGKQPRMQPENAKRRVDELTARLEQRKRELETMRNVVSSTPKVIGGALVIPTGLLAKLSGSTTFTTDAEARRRVELLAMNAVMDAERNLGHDVMDVSAEKCGWDITSRPKAKNGRLPADRHIEVKGRAKGQTTITITANEIIYALNQKDKFILAVVIVEGDLVVDGPYYIQNPFDREPDFGEESRNYQLASLLKRSAKPEQTVGVQ